MSESGGLVVVLAATNDITRLDPALLRPGRLDRRVFLGPPDSAARSAIFLQRLRAMPLQLQGGGDDDSGRDSPSDEGTGLLASRENSPAPGDKGIRTSDSIGQCRRQRGLLDSTEAYAEWLAAETDGASGAQVTGVCREAALAALREGIEAAEVAPRHFAVALSGQRPRGVVAGGKF